MNADAPDSVAPPPPQEHHHEESPRRDDGATPPPPPPPAGPPPPPPPAATSTATPTPTPTPVQATAPSISSIPAHVKSSASAPPTPSSSAPTSPGHGPQTPHSKLVSHQPLDSPDELDRKWYAHFYHMQKTIQGKDDATTLAILKQQPPSAATGEKGGSSAALSSPLTFQPDIALLYAIVTEPPLAKQYLRFLTSIAAADNYKNVIGLLQKLIEHKFTKMLGPCRSQLLWLVREFVHINVPSVDKVIVSLLRHLTGGDASRTSVWLASSIVRILNEHEAWLLSCSSFIPYVFHTFARIVVDHTAQTTLLQQEIELCTLLWNRRQSDVAQLGREVVRVLNDAKDIAGMNTLWKQLRAVRDDSDQDAAILSVSRLMATPTPAKYLAYRLSPKIEEYLVFMMEKVQLTSVTRYQKWFASQFLAHPGSDALVPDLVRYVCAVYHPSNQILSSKVTPRYHILGWLYLLCKTPAVLARVQLAMFFDYLYFRPSDNIMNVEPAMLLMAKSLKSHPQMTLAMIQFLVFAVEKFAASSANKISMQKGVSTALSMLLKVGVVPSIHPLQSFPLLLSSAPELKSELHRIFPEHFPSPDAIQLHEPSPLHSPAALASPLHMSGVMSSPGPASPAHESPMQSPVGAGSPAASPVHPQSPSHSDSSSASAATSTDSLSTSSFLPTNQSVQDASATEIPETATLLTDTSSMVAAVSVAKSEDIPAELLVLGHEEFKSFQDMMPEACTRPTEGFLESLNDILISWIRQDNAQDLAAPLGSFLHASLEKIIVTARISTSNVPKATCSGVFDSMLDQVLSEPQELYVPFLLAMQARDVTMSFRLLAFLCSRSEGKSVEATLAPYLAFIDAMGGSLSQTLVKDLTVTQHIDDARAHAIAFLGKSAPRAAAAVKDEVDAVDAAVLHILPYLFRNLEHPSLTKLLARSETLIQLFLSLMTPSTFQTISARLILHEFSLLNTRLTNLLLASLTWSSWEQFVLWDLVIVETQAANAVTAVKAIMAAARKVLACVNPDEHVETLNGLLKCLVQFTPDASMLQTIFKLNAAYDEFALATLSSWIHKCPDAVKNFMLVILPTGGESSKDVEQILHKLELLQRRRSSHTLLILKDEAVLAVLRNLVTPQDFPTLASFVVSPAIPNTPPLPPPSPSQLAASPLMSPPRSSFDDEPPVKKQRVGDEQ